MNPESRRALLELMSYGVEDLSSSNANQLMQVVDRCPECHGQWVLVQRTITSLSETGELPVEEAQSHQMWLVCLSHAQSHHNHRNTNGTHRKHGA